MLRILRAFAWMRWRILINSLEKTHSRDAVQRLSLAIEPLLPFIVGIVMVPSAIALAGLGGLAGFARVAEGNDFLFQLVRYILFGGVLFSFVGPIVMPGADRSNPVRMLLLPIPARTLYVAHAAGALVDPWIALMLPVMLGLPLGLAAGGAGAAAGVALIAGVVVAFILVGVSAFATTVLHLLLRNRRRGELVALLFILVLPIIGFLPAALGSRDRGRHRDRGRVAPQERPVPREPRLPAWLSSVGERVFAAVPSEIYTTTVERAVASGPSTAMASLSVLVVVAGGFHGIGLALFRRVLSAPGSTSSRTSRSMARIWIRHLPGVSPGTSAVALALFRLALRTPRGRSILLGPVLMVTVLPFLARSGPFLSWGGVGLAAFGSVVSRLSALPITMNQFAVDGAGLTMGLLAPLSTRQLLVGKAVGGALISMTPAVFCIAFAAIVLPGGSLGLWLAVPLSLVATLTLASPADAVLSATFARVVDMNSIGRGSNAHGLAGLFGMLAFAAAGAPCAALTVGAMFLDRLYLAPVLLVLWCFVALAIARLLFVPAERIFDARRESLAMLL